MSKHVKTQSTSSLFTLAESATQHLAGVNSQQQLIYTHELASVVNLFSFFESFLLFGIFHVLKSVSGESLEAS